MSEAKDPAIKLFGRTIPRPESSPAADGDSTGAGETQDCDEAPSCERQIDSKQDEKSYTFTSQESKDPNEIALTDDNPKTPIADNETPASTTRKTEEEQSEASNLQDKAPKKPDKVLPCPRCNSMDTKFCYYNNYNVSQPRHFCKNCQRYWTAGGSMRNVPVGAGRRKNKNSASHYRHITVSEALQNGRIEPLNGAHFPTVRPNGTVLSFGSDTPLCESMASVLIADKTSQNCAQNGLHKSENPKVSVPYRVGESSDDQSSMSSVTVANVKDENGRSKPTHVMMQNCHSYPPQVPVFAGPPWPYPLNTAQWFPSSGVLPPGYPTPFYPALPYWGCPVQIPWPAPWVAPPLSTSPISPTLGKHCRDENSSKQSDVGEEEEEEKEKKRESSTKKSLWIPKTLRIDDPGDAAKSSIWATLGIKHEKCDSAIGGGGKGGLFKAFQSKTNENSDSSDTSPVLQANPAALSRSRNFHESS